MKRKGLRPLIAFMVLVLGAFGAVLALDYKPLLGLDLQGGVSVVLQPSNDVPSDQLDQAIDIIRSRVDALGVAEPDISRQGDTILVQLPGVDNQSRALDLVGQTAELRFRPVCGVLPPPGAEPETPTTLPTDAAPTDTAPTTVPAGGATTVPGSPATTAPTTDSSATDSEAGLPATPGAFEGESAAAFQTDTTGLPATTDPPETVPVDPTASTVPATPVPGTTDAAADGGCTAPPAEDDLNRNGITRRADDRPGQQVILPQVDPECSRDPGDPADKCWLQLYWMGPTALKGEALSDATATFPNNEWLVNPVFKSGEDGIENFNAVAAECNSGAPTCPSQQLAIVLDGEVISAPTINEPSFARDQIQISGAFDEGSAKDLALVLRYGSLPVELEPQQTQTVSATLGNDALQAGLIAGMIGLAIATLFTVLYYRILGVVAMFSLLVAAVMLWTAIAYLGETRGLALTLAGVTGIIVSIGISLDSNIVYYEHIKEDVYNGRTLRSSVDRSFDSAFSTIVKADSASLIGAGILYFLTVGAVRGFAFYLGLAAVIDLVVFYFFLRPSVALMIHSKRLGSHPSWFGIPKRREPDGPLAGTMEAGS